ncbi:cytochrome c oxidase assembly protein [Conexibacter sp. W3-3-2]|uniref:cytochrome c oxidase assembly protein n=1 Tax=Conexibacter sp. W3-3-2 TaxID=2675227 RepID=UPI0012B73DA8|nr:cytochrome c oxidase assembly protein [Conexibacter sp. W3-3-2]MTD46311.1 cytochrome c oxidase assembly protein [Conexibacter sp. W3-3-2]
MTPDTSWTFAPGPALLVALLLGGYVWRWRAVRRTPSGARDAPIWRLLVFLGGIVSLSTALFSPLDALGEQLFAMHMVQHVLLLDVVPILLILGLTKVLLRPVTRLLQPLERQAGWWAGPVFAILLYVGVMWVWHIPALYDSAVESSAIHILEHVSFTFGGALYWWHLLSPIRARHGLAGLGPVVCMVVTKVLVGILGIFLTFAPRPLYDVYANGPRYWGLSALDDQALAGAIMAIEQSVVMGIALAFLFIRALGEADRADERAERHALDGQS